MRKEIIDLINVILKMKDLDKAVERITISKVGDNAYEIIVTYHYDYMISLRIVGVDLFEGEQK